MASTPDFDRLADELYALAPGDFTAARNHRADQLKKSDPQLAKRLRTLHRPTLAAWAANLLAHRHGGLVERLLDLGQALRDAQEHLAGDELRALTEQRRQLVRALTGQARQEAAAAGHPLGADAVADLERTLSAALADPDAAHTLARGRLTAPLEPVLWPGAAPGGPEAEAAAVPGAAGEGKRARPGRRGARPEPSRPPSPSTVGEPGGEPVGEPVGARKRAESAKQRQRRQQQREREQAHERALERARRAVAEAEAAAREAAGRRDAAAGARGDAESARQRAEDEAERARAALAEARERDARAQEELTRAEEQLQAAGDAADVARDQAARARQALRAAVEHLRELESAGPVDDGN
ncbi:hypothetical protein ACFVHB_25705 [Kitasatospora sp. NPDC127111]|uniref:hypothetical protein n=1 Tax=Kitasatospora sp. NPDC127111 TaxID=3345363 RepID=UPI00363C2C5A